MSNCNRCGKYLPGFFDSICQECESIESERNEDRERDERAASAISEMRSEIERSREQSSEDLAAAAVYIADAKNNPGDYICPHCKFRTLKRSASRCPSCHGEPGSHYWAEIGEKEQDARLCTLAAEKKWEQIAPAREAAANLKKLNDKKTEITNNKSFFFSLFNKQSKLDAITGEIEKAKEAEYLAIKSLVEIKSHDGIVTLIGNSHYVRSVVFSPDGKLLASNSGNEFLLWSVAERQFVGCLSHWVTMGAVDKYQFGRYLSQISFSSGCAAFSPDGKLLASGGEDKSIKLWSVAERQGVATLTGHSGRLLTVIVDPDFRTVN